MHFEKQNPNPRSSSLEVERKGLLALKNVADEALIKIPNIIDLKNDTLLLQKIDGTAPTADMWKNLGLGLAKIHQQQAESFGLDYNNYIGRNEQLNGEFDDWGLFFVEKRLLVQAHWIASKSLRDEVVHILKNMLPHISKFLNAYQPFPSLVHGDLWSGNVMFSAEGPWLIDPAVYYADREVDIAMTKMFGGFAAEFYSAYEAQLPLAQGHELRAEIYNLYHYLNHYNLFGDSYWRGVENGLAALKNV